MAALTEMSSRDVSMNDTNSTIDRVRVRMTRLMHLSRDRPAPPNHEIVSVPNHEIVSDNRQGTVAGTSSCESLLSPLAADVCALQEILDDSDKLIREAWNVAAELNQVRRQCSRCESVSVLVEALGTFQGLLNRCQHNVRSATKSLDNIRAAVSSVRG